MKTFILFALLLNVPFAFSQNDKAYFAGGTEASSLVRCGLKLAIQKIKTRGVPGHVKLAGEINKQEMDKSESWMIYHDLNRVGIATLDFKGSLGQIPIEGTLLFFAQKKLDASGNVMEGTLCKIAGYNQLNSKNKRRFILRDTKSGFEID